MNHFYQEMQNSDEVWLGKVPSQWKSYRIKDITRLSPNFSNGAPGKEEICSVIPMEKVSEKGEIISDNVEEYNLSTSGLTNFEVGDVIFAKITPCMENGKGAYVKILPTRYAFGSTEFHVLRPRYIVDGKFLYYYTYNSVYREYAKANMTGAAGQKRVSSQFINYTRIFLPDIQIQHRITAYLDKTCAAIDKTIEAKQKQLKILDALRKSIIHKAVTRGLDDSVEVKDSGVEWIGRIPKHWNYEHLKRVCSRIQTGSTPPTANTEYYVDGTIPWYAPGCYDGGIYLLEPAKEINEIAYLNNKLRLYPAHSIFLVGIGATIGKVAMTRVEASCNQQITALVCNSDVYAKYLTYHLKIFESIIPRIAQFTTLPIIDQNKIGYLQIALPPIKEQEQIAEFLDDKIAKNAKLENNLVKQISTLKQYRKSLIHECVTGKRRINEEQTREQ